MLYKWTQHIKIKKIAGYLVVPNIFQHISIGCWVLSGYQRFPTQGYRLLGTKWLPTFSNTGVSVAGYLVVTNVFQHRGIDCWGSSGYQRFPTHGYRLLGTKWLPTFSNTGVSVAGY